MVVDDGSAQEAVWPLPKFYFQVDLGGGMKSAAFQEVSGLDDPDDGVNIAFRNTNDTSIEKMPGIQKYGNVTMKKGVLVKDNHFFDWYTTIQMNTMKRVTMTVRLLDEDGNTTMRWTLTNAFVTKITGTDLKSDGNEVAIETLEIVHEGIETG